MMKQSAPAAQKYRLRSLVAMLGIICCLSAVSSRAFADACEPPGSDAIAEAALEAAEASAVAGMVATLSALYHTEIQLAQTTILAALTGWTQTLDLFWERWLQAWKDMTKQISASYADQNRQLVNIMDAANLSGFGRTTQQTEMDAKKLYQPTEVGCQFDTNGRYLSQGRGMSERLTIGYALDFNKIGNNDKDSPASAGEASLQDARWKSYTTKLCDSTANNGHSGCTAAASNVTNMHVTPGKTIFAKETIDLANPDVQRAVNELLFNITGYQAPETVLLGALESSSSYALQQRQETREYAAQMDAVTALAASVVAERAPGALAPQVQAARVAMGITDASPTPSAREIRQSIIEQLWNPGYYTGLNDSPNSTMQKEVYLKAYSLVMLYDMISKQEKISNVYAIETANMLDRLDRSRDAATASAPVKKP